MNENERTLKQEVRNLRDTIKAVGKRDEALRRQRHDEATSYARFLETRRDDAQGYSEWLKDVRGQEASEAVTAPPTLDEAQVLQGRIAALETATDTEKRYVLPALQADYDDLIRRMKGQLS